MRVLILALLAICAAVPGQAQDELGAVRVGIEQRGERLKQIDITLEAPGADILGLRDDVRRIRRESEQATAPLRAQVTEIRADIERLGPVPEEGAPSETEEIAAERARLNEELARIDGAIRRADLNVAEADRIIAEIAQIRRDRFYAEVFARGPTPLSPRQWRWGSETFANGLSGFRSAVENWRSEVVARGNTGRVVITLGVAVLIAIALFIPFRRWVDRIIKGRMENLDPLPSRRVLVAAGRSAARVLPGLIGGLIILEALRINGAITPEGEPLARAIWFGFVAVLLVDSAALGISAPNLPAWRVVPLETRQANLARFLLLTATLVLALEIILIRGAELFANSSPLMLLVQSLTTALLAVILFLLCGIRLRPSASDDPLTVDEEDRASWRRARLAGRVIAVAAIVALPLGYVALGHYVLTRLFYLLALGAVIWLLRALLREGVRTFDEQFGSAGDPKADDQRITTFWIGVAIDIVAVLAFIPPALLILGAEWSDVRDGIGDAFLGFNVGTVRISMAEMLSALVVFLGVLYLARLLRRALETRILPKSRIDIGIQNSLKTLIGYVGLVLAFAAGVATLGFDLSNLAIIAGALSVGIGFGLQSIVNNFVSGLILLFERPIKVGDWIITSSGEGIVKRISVRSTEIETFDRSSVIVPNSELISGAVTNWTHKDKLGRVIIPVGVSYDADPEQVIELLVQVAHDHPAILAFPAPFVYFSDFADSSLNFELRGYLRDINISLTVRTELRVAIFKKLKEAGIEIPFPQRDLHIKGGTAAAAAQS